VVKSIIFLKFDRKEAEFFQELHTSRETQRECEFGVKNNRWTIILNYLSMGSLEEVIFGRGWSPPIPAILSELAIAPADRSKG